MKPEEENLITKKMWTSKDVWKAVSSVAIAVFVITMIYAQFLSMGKDIQFLTKTVETLENVIETQSSDILLMQLGNVARDVKIEANTTLSKANDKLAHEKRK